MKTYLLRVVAPLAILLTTGLTGCKKTEEAVPAPVPQLTCQTADYVSLDGGPNANRYAYTLTYLAAGRPGGIEYGYTNTASKTPQKATWLYNYKTPGKVIIDQTLGGQPYGTSTLTLDDQGRATRRDDVSTSGAKTVYEYAYDGGGYLAKIKKGGVDEIVITAENGFLRSAKIGATTATITTNEQQGQAQQPIPLYFLNISWPYVDFLGKPFRGLVTGYTSGYTYQITYSLTGQGGLINRDITYTDPATNKPVNSLKETFTTTCK